MPQQNKHSDIDAFEIIEAEGPGYAVTDYVSGDRFSNPDTARLWKAANQALAELVLHLERETGREFDG